MQIIGGVKGEHIKRTMEKRLFSFKGENLMLPLKKHFMCFKGGVVKKTN